MAKKVKRKKTVRKKPTAAMLKEMRLVKLERVVREIRMMPSGGERVEELSRYVKNHLDALNGRLVAQVDDGSFSVRTFRKSLDVVRERLDHLENRGFLYRLGMMGAWFKYRWYGGRAA